METPEKIYVHKSQYWGLMANERNITKNGIEYTRTDAFIKNAAVWFNNHFTTHDKYGVMANSFNTTEEMFEDFKNYIKGECVKPTDKAADKVEPKFHEGMWLTENQPNNYARFVQILEIVNVQGKKRYRISRDLHNDEDIVECRFIEDNWHPFNIHDAKEGDVLADSKGDVILMFRRIGNTEWNDVIDYHCYYDCYRKDFIVQEDIEYWGNVENNQLKPATEEQRDFLFSKIHEAGYEWVVNKKELKKIEKKLEEKFTIPSLKDFQEAFELKAKQYDIELPNRGYDIHAMCKELYSLLIKPKPTWSEEDEVELNGLIKHYEDGHVSTSQNRKTIKWLKSLKERIGG